MMEDGGMDREVYRGWVTSVVRRSQTLPKHIRYVTSLFKRITF